jgi:hypothetical protein
MECARIKELLSEYIDGTLGAQARAVVADHVATCKSCKEELASLSALVEELGSLETVKAPEDFLEKIHGRMESRFGFDTIVRKLFRPFGIKIPLELAAAATIAILVISVLSIQQAEKQIVQIPKVSTSERIAEKSKENLVITARKKSAKSPASFLEEAPTKRSDSQLIISSRESMLKTVKPASKEESKPLAPVLAKPKERQPVGDVRENEPIELALLLKSEVTDKAYNLGSAVEDTSSLERGVRAGEEEGAYSASSGRKATAGYTGADAEPLSRVKHIVGLVEGKVLAVEYDGQTEQLKSIQAEIPAKRYESFCKELARLAVFQNPPPALSDKDRETIRIRIRFIHL